MLNGLDLFSGIGGLSLSLSPWVSPTAYCEADPYCQGVLLSRMACGQIPKAPIWDDVRTLTAADLDGASIDIICGGFPCQDISIAGAGAGLGGSRSGLFFEVVRLARELRPSFLFLENVPAVTIRGLDRILMELVALGFDCRWTIVSAGEMGACHLRERWWLCAHANRTGFQKPWGFADSSHEHRRASWDTAFPLVQRDVWNKSASDVCRMDDGISPKTHRLRALGNAVVPHAAREAFMRLMGIGEINVQRKVRA